MMILVDSGAGNVLPEDGHVLVHLLDDGLLLLNILFLSFYRVAIASPHLQDHVDFQELSVMASQFVQSCGHIIERVERDFVRSQIQLVIILILESDLIKWLKFLFLPDDVLHLDHTVQHHLEHFDALHVHSGNFYLNFWILESF